MSLMTIWNIRKDIYIYIKIININFDFGDTHTDSYTWFDMDICYDIKDIVSISQ